MTDRDKAGLRGPVRLCTTESKYWSRRCGPEHCDTEISSARHTHEYDRAGALLSAQWRNSDGSESSWTGPPPPPTIETKTRRGRKVTIERIPAFPDTTSYMHSTEGVDSHCGAPSGGRVETWFDREDHPVELRIYSAHGVPAGRVRFAWDSAGNLLEEHHWMGLIGTDGAWWFGLAFNLIMRIAQRSFRSLPVTVTSHRYDGRGRRIETRRSTGPLGDEHIRRTWNDEGDQTSESVEHTSRNAGLTWLLRLRIIGESRHAHENRMEYRYDDRGNWTEKRIFSRGLPDGEWQLSSEEHRTLEYF